MRTGIHTPLHDGMVVCTICKHHNIFTEKDAHPIVTGAARCHYCGNLTPITGTIIDLLGALTADEVDDDVTFGPATYDAINLRGQA